MKRCAGAGASTTRANLKALRPALPREGRTAPAPCDCNLKAEFSSASYVAEFAKRYNFFLVHNTEYPLNRRPCSARIDRRRPRGVGANESGDNTGLRLVISNRLRSFHRLASRTSEEQFESKAPFLHSSWQRFELKATATLRSVRIFTSQFAP